MAAATDELLERARRSQCLDFVFFELSAPSQILQVGKGSLGACRLDSATSSFAKAFDQSEAQAQRPLCAGLAAANSRRMVRLFQSRIPVAFHHAHLAYFDSMPLCILDDAGRGVETHGLGIQERSRKMR